MDSLEIDTARSLLPGEIPFAYFADRESPWLLAQRIGASARVHELKKSALTRWLERPLVKPIVAQSGGVLRRDDLEAVAFADRAVQSDLSSAAWAGLEAAYDQPWFDFCLSFTWWGVSREEAGLQMSRRGGNLVVQLGFPSDHAALMGQYLGAVDRKAFEEKLHPVRRTGRPTLAWARLDLCAESRTALIEEIQSDWLRFAAYRARLLAARRPRSREMRAMQLYEQALRERYGKMWPKVTMLASLALLRDVFGVERVFMHQPWTGCMLKRIHGSGPPVSLYTALPKSFGFLPTDDVPPFLERLRRRDFKRLSKRKKPLFWEISLRESQTGLA